MSENTAAAGEAESSADLRRTLIKRLAVAGVLVAVLLGVLAFFDYLSTSEEPEPTVYTKPVPVPPKKEVTQPVTPFTTLPEPPAVAPDNPPPPPTVEAPPKPAVQAVPSPPAAAEAQPEAKTTPMRPAPPVTAHPPTARPAQPAPAPAPESAAAPKTPAANEAAAPAPARPAEAVAARTQPQAAPRLFSGYVVQAGVFTSVQNAEELRAKLTLNGIPSTIEARVEVGPFKNHGEAQAAREKLKTLGIDAVLIPPQGKR